MMKLYKNGNYVPLPSWPLFALFMAAWLILMTAATVMEMAMDYISLPEGTR